MEPYSECYSSENLENYKNELKPRIMKLVFQKAEIMEKGLDKVEKIQNGWNVVPDRLQQLKNCHQIMEDFYTINNGNQLKFTNSLEIIVVMITCFYGVL